MSQGNGGHDNALRVVKMGYFDANYGAENGLSHDCCLVILFIYVENRTFLSNY